MKVVKLINKISQVLFLYIVSLLIYSCDNSLEQQRMNNFIPKLVLISQDLTFTMGRLDLPNWSYTNETEIPTFKAILTPYYIGKYEVRNDEYIYFVKEKGYTDSTLWSDSGWYYIKTQNRTKPVDWIEGEEPWINCSLSNTPDRPINNISWYEAEAYCNWLSKKTGEIYSLPTEAQWERAARGPDPGRPFPWGDKDDQTKLNNMMYTRLLYPVGSFEAGKSYDGCYDMAGNTMEFCSDLYDLYIYKTYKENEPVFNPSGPDSNITGQKSIRGSFTIFHYDYDTERQITTFRRMACMPEDYYQVYGFRIVKNNY